MLKYSNIYILNIFNNLKTNRVYILILIILFFIFFSTNFSYSNYIYYLFDSGVKKIDIPSHWSYDKIPIDEKTKNFLFFNKLSNIDIIVTEKKDRVPIRCRSNDFFSVKKCSKDEYIYRSIKEYTYIKYSCELYDTKRCNSLLAKILYNFEEKSKININRKQYIIDQDWKLIERGNIGTSMFYLIVNKQKPDNLFVFYERRSFKDDDIMSFLNNNGFHGLAKNEELKKYFFSKANLLYLDIDNDNSRTVLNIKLGKRLLVRGFIGDKNLLEKNKEFYDLVITKDFSKTSLNPSFVYVKKEGNYCFVSKRDSYFIYNRYRFYRKDNYSLFLNNKSDLNWKTQYIYNKKYYHTFISYKPRRNLTVKIFRNLQGDNMETIDCYFADDTNNMTDRDIIRMVYDSCMK